MDNIDEEESACHQAKSAGGVSFATLTMSHGVVTKGLPAAHSPLVDLHRIVSDPDILSGKPVVRGTRIPVYLIANFVETGHTPAEIVAAYPALTEADIAAAVAYAQQERERTEVRPW